MEINHKQLIFAREYRGYSQTELAKKIDGLSQSNLSKFEKGISTLSNELLDKIIRFLEFPQGFFNQSIYNNIENPHYRKRSTATKRVINDIDSRVKLIGYIIDQMSESIEWPDFKFSVLNVEDGYSPENIAKHTRKLLGLKYDKPVEDIFQLVEQNGIIVVEIDITEKFDGVSIKTDAGYPVIIINKRFSNDRKRFTIAHELGHMLMHVLADFPISDFRDSKVKEKEADRFASEFLMPAEGIKNSLYNLKISDLAGLKRYWLTSMASIVYKAYYLDCIDRDRYTYLNIEMSRLGLKKDEKLSVIIDKPSLFDIACKMHKNDLGYSNSELSEAFNLPIDIINEFCNNMQKRSKLKIVKS
jgi:Zn-dependent peptidase ImmA (M78 family)/transcriptional regulator with XRE-family HTH domain